MVLKIVGVVLRKDKIKDIIVVLKKREEVERYRKSL